LPGNQLPTRATWSCSVSPQNVRRHVQIDTDRFINLFVYIRNSKVYTCQQGYGVIQTHPATKIKQGLWIIMFMWVYVCVYHPCIIVSSNKSVFMQFDVDMDIIPPKQIYAIIFINILSLILIWQPRDTLRWEWIIIIYCCYLQCPEFLQENIANDFISYEFFSAWNLLQSWQFGGGGLFSLYKF
jgi:hypothetical protein